MNNRLAVALLACFCFILCLPAFSQQNFTPGTIELPSGEKLNGFICFDQKGVNPRTILFKRETNATEQQFTPATAKGFSLEGGATYISQIVSKDLLPVTREDAVAPGLESNVQDRVFLKVLTTGPTLTLYELKEDKVHYYIKKPDGAVEELLYKVFRGTTARDQLMGKDDVVFHHIFRNQLRVFAFEDDGLVSKIDNSSYTARDLQKMVDGINELASEENRRPPPATKRIMIGGGLTVGNQFTFSGPSFQQLDVLQSSTSGGYVLKAGADFFGKRKLKKTFVRTELAYSHFAYEGSFERAATAEYFLTINTLSATVSVAQNLVQTANFQLYVGAGTGINFSSYPKNDIVSTNPNTFQEDWQVKNVWHEALLLRSGIFYKGWNVEAAYRVFGSPFSYTTVNSRYNMLALTLAYEFRL